MAENGRRIFDQSKSPVDKEIRLRSLKDRQNEDRQRKLEEIKAQALAAQIFKEQKEQERRRRLEELRIRDDERRQQVEERKKAINEAERDRLEFIFKRNQERDQRMESKKRNERSNAVFAFGSSTPRNLDPCDISASYWGARRATSIQNIVTSTNSSTLTRRQSERDLDGGTKKRATSATGLERTGESSAPVIPAGCVSGYIGRRRTDLVPTIPTKESISSSRKSLNHSPGRASSMTRLDQLAKPRRRHDLPSVSETNPFRPLSSSSHSSVTRSMSHLAVSKPGPSLTRRELNKADSRSMQQLTERPFGLPRTTRTTQLREQKMLASSNCSEASSRPSSSLSQQSTNSLASSISVRHRLTTGPKKPRPVSIAVTGISSDNKPPLPKTRKTIAKTTTTATNDKVVLKNKAKTPVDSAAKTIKNAFAATITSKEDKPEKPHDKATNSNQKSEENRVPPSEYKPVNVNGEVETSINMLRAKENNLEITAAKKLEGNPETIEGKMIKIEIKDVETDKKENLPKTEIKDMQKRVETLIIDTESNVKDVKPIKSVVNELEKPLEFEKTKHKEEKLVEEKKAKPVKEDKPLDTEKDKNGTSQTISGIETVVDSQLNMEYQENEMTTSMTKIRINTEEEAKAALAERRRLIREEAERQAEMERLRIEAEAKAELERQQKEEEQIRQLIELQRQTEQERLQEAIKEAQKREEEEKLRKEEEHRLKLLKEEAEKKAKEDAERQKAELQERLKNEEKEREARRKRVEAIMLRTRGKNNAFNTQSTDEKNENKSEEIKSVESKVNGTKIEEQENGTTAKDIVDNLIPSEIVKNANSVTIESISTNDSINSNNTWRDNQQYDSLT